MRREPRLTADPGKLPTPAERPEAAAGVPDHYAAFYGLAAPPFEADQSPLPVFRSRQPALQGLIVGLRRDHGNVILLGERGSGKSALVQAILRERPDIREQAFVLDRTRMEDAALRKALSAGASKMVVIDDADQLRPAELARIREWSDLGGSGPARLWLAGTPDLRSLLQDARLRPIMSDVAMRVQLAKVQDSEILLFLRDRIWRVGSSIEKLATPKALRMIVRQADGNPGHARDLMEAALVAGFLRGDQVIGRRTVEQALGSFAPDGGKTKAPRSGRWMSVLAFLVLLAGIAMFLWTGLRSQPPAGEAPGNRQPGQSVQ